MQGLSEAGRLLCQLVYYVGTFSNYQLAINNLQEVLSKTGLPVVC
jgi:hypothetical protein